MKAKKSIAAIVLAVSLVLSVIFSLLMVGIDTSWAPWM